MNNKIEVHIKSQKNKSNDSLRYLSKDSVGMPLHQPPVHNIRSNAIESIV